MQHVETLAFQDLQDPPCHLEAEGDPGHRVVGRKWEHAADAIEVRDLLRGASTAGGGEGAYLMTELAKPGAEMPEVLR